MAKTKVKTTKQLAVMTACTGEAHRNPYIDNCGVCMPQWGFVLSCAQCGTRLEYARNSAKLKTACPKCGARHADENYGRLWRQQHASIPTTD